jgi:pimeloyl-ACP methyl ester carboxylesterase
MEQSSRSRFVLAGGVKTHYTESGGDGPVLLALHGGGAGSSGAAGMGALMTLLSDEFRVIGLDSVGGFGLTDPAGPATYGLQSRVDHLAAFMDALCLDRVTLIGNSHGAWCAAKYAVMRPDRVERLILLATASLVDAMGLPVAPPPGRRLLEGYDGTREAMRRLLEGLVYDKSKVTEELIDLRQASAQRPGAPAALKAMNAANRRLQTEPLYRPMFDLSTALPALTKIIPAIMIWGENDEFALPELGRRLEPLLPDVAFHWVERAGHQVQTDRPDVVARIVRDFVSSTVHPRDAVTV